MITRALKASLALLVICVAPAYAHHAAEGIVDEEIYDMIDSLVEDTPHAAMTLDDLGGRMAETTIYVESLTDLEGMITEGLLEYISGLQGDVVMSISFAEDGSVLLTLTQTAEPISVQDGVQ